MKFEYKRDGFERLGGFKAGIYYNTGAFTSNTQEAPEYSKGIKLAIEAMDESEQTQSNMFVAPSKER